MYDKLSCSSVNYSQSKVPLEIFHAILTEIIRVHLAENPGEHRFNMLPYDVITIRKTKYTCSLLMDYY